MNNQKFKIGDVVTYTKTSIEVRNTEEEVVSPRKSVNGIGKIIESYRNPNTLVWYYKVDTEDYFLGEFELSFA